MRRRLPLLAATVALATVAAASPSPAATVSVRVDSTLAATPLFEGAVTTVPHAVDGNDGSGPHPCSGPPSGTPSATATGALDDALRLAGIPWRGNWDPSFRDFFIDRIGPYASAPPDLYWALTVNGRFAPGGCLARVADGDAIRFSFGPLFGDEAGSGPGTSPGGPGAEDPGAAPPPPVSRARIRRIARAATRFLRRHRGPGEEWARLALAVRGGGDTASAAREILGRRLGSQRRDGSIAGEVNATALAVLALGAAAPTHQGASRTRACAWLAATQEPGGGFGYRPGVAADVDSTGLAAWALALCRRHGAVGRAAAFVRSTQTSDGGFPSLPGGSTNAQSTGLGLVALRLAGIAPGTVRSPTGASPLDSLTALARRNGSIAYAPGSSPTPVWTTAQALLGLTSARTLLAAG